jgi:YidC/Oxa1 family membrane protein insertase
MPRKLFKNFRLSKHFLSVQTVFQDVALVAAVAMIPFLAEVMMDNQNNSFMDKRTLIAATLVGILFVGWQSYLKNKYGNQPAAPQATTPVAAETTKPATASTGSPEISTNAQAEKAAVSAPAAEKPESKLGFENKNVSFEITSKGMGLKNLVLKDHTDRKHEPQRLGVSEKHSLYELSVLGSPTPLDFALTKASENEYQGTAQAGNVVITRKITIDPETGALNNEVQATNIDNTFPGFVVTIPEKSVGEISRSMFMPSLETQEFVISHSGTDERINSSAAKEKIDKSFPGVSLLSLSSQYFTSTILDKSEITPEAKVVGGKETPELTAQMIYKPAANGKNTMDLKWISYSGGKSLTTLEKIDKDLSKVLDLGFFATIGRWLLYTMRWFHSVIPNWGLAIILLTMMVRLLVLPLNVTTFRSTKKMQKLQPLIASLRERYKDDPQAMNREMMALWKEHKVNPMGGCLPMLLQLPIFFAWYRVLGQSIELYQAPFFGWIQDLSLKDPFYVLPILMAVCMFVQQKLTPTTMDPSQAKVMQFLPLMFAVMMINLPAGLTLYIFINTLSGIILQQIFMHDRATATKAKEAKA